MRAGRQLRPARHKRWSSVAILIQDAPHFVNHILNITSLFIGFFFQNPRNRLNFSYFFFSHHEFPEPSRMAHPFSQEAPQAYLDPLLGICIRDYSLRAEEGLSWFI